MFADIGDDERDDNDDEHNDEGDEVTSPSTALSNSGNKGNETTSVDTVAASGSEPHEEDVAHEEGKVEDDEYEVELIPMKEEDDNEQQPLVNSSNDGAATTADTVEELPSGLNTDQLTAHIGKLLALLVDEQTLAGLGWPAASCEHVLSGVIKQCGLRPADTVTCPDYVSVMRENAKMLFTSVISNDSIRSLLNNHTVDEVILHVLKMAN